MPQAEELLEEADLGARLLLEAKAVGRRLLVLDGEAHLREPLRGDDPLGDLLLQPLQRPPILIELGLEAFERRLLGANLVPKLLHRRLVHLPATSTSDALPSALAALAVLLVADPEKGHPAWLLANPRQRRRVTSCSAAFAATAAFPSGASLRFSASTACSSCRDLAQPVLVELQLHRRQRARVLRPRHLLDQRLPPRIDQETGSQRREARRGEKRRGEAMFGGPRGRT